VDISAPRLAICRSLLKKQKIINTRLICANGTLFQQGPPWLALAKLNQEELPHGELLESDSCFYAPKTIRTMEPKVAFKNDLYDKVIVDAECACELPYLCLGRLESIAIA
jgi:hypothetical protein